MAACAVAACAVAARAVAARAVAARAMTSGAGAIGRETHDVDGNRLPPGRVVPRIEMAPRCHDTRRRTGNDGRGRTGEGDA
jgi:hypothetical protein